MKLTTLFAVILSMLCLCPSVRAEAANSHGDNAVLFGQFHHGQPYSELAALEQAYDCSELMGSKALCLDGLEFLGREWATVLEFTKDQLTLVALFTPFSRDIYVKTFKELSRDFRLVAMQSGQPALDIVALEAELGPHAPYSGQVVDYEQAGMAASNLTYVLLEKSALSELSASSAMQMRALAAPSVREVGVVLYKDSQGLDMLSLSYSRPRMLVDPEQ